MKLCPICGNAPAAPFRAYDERGRVLNGCVDETHTGHLVVPSASASWHNRPEAKALRRRLAAARRSAYSPFYRRSVA